MMNPQRWIGRLALAAIVGVSSVAVAAGSPAGPQADADSPSLGAGGEYHPLAPTRIFDSRNGINDSAPLGVKPTSAQGATFDVDILGQGGIPADRRQTCSPWSPTSPSSARASTGSCRSIRPAPAAAIARSSTSPPARRCRTSPCSVSEPTAAWTISLVTPAGAGSAHVLIDVFGWISTSQYADVADSGARFTAIAPITCPRHPVDARPRRLVIGQAIGAMRAADAADPWRQRRGAELGERHRRDGQPHRRQRSRRATRRRSCRPRPRRRRPVPNRPRRSPTSRPVRSRRTWRSCRSATTAASGSSTAPAPPT